ncbi:hypothetical protein EDC39_106187 [Geothermobacter ehrlichii]|uniref:Holliday junction resolvasome RuvABC endonuclease subunit n=1 Tax=Geothermobacter ehrlichii TaxID=213224 RepID=A0A5D3WJU9_9BACT|nr:hypothetical protein [Geothermobacter ehrlichii]TYO98581.1 hypothetical protein EDC39_106187 [Geothermobacter ehrlichii]
MLLAVDIGVRCGLACYGRDGRLRWYRSSNFGDAARLRRAIPGLLDAIDGLEWLACEGGGSLAALWLRQAEQRELQVLLCQAADWRQRLLLPRQRRSGGLAKEQAGILARKVIGWSGTRRPSSLRHDAAEAILIGLYAVVRIGWLDAFPDLGGRS